MFWISALFLTLVTFLLGARNTGGEPFVELRTLDAWTLGFVPGVVTTLWALLAAWTVREHRRRRHTAKLAIALIWCAMGVSSTLSVPWMYFSDLSRNQSFSRGDSQ